MKTAIWTLIFIAAATPAVLYFYQRWRQNRAQRSGVVVYATVVRMELIRKFGKVLPMKKITLSLQEPDKERRTVTLRTQVPAGQKIDPGMMLPIVVDPRNPNRIYPATPEAAERLVYTGSRSDRRQLKSGRGVGRPTIRGRRAPR